ncbi:MAG: acetate kinase [Proteobacteria bacterium]|nr:MAG: acetate kinase [Pseudomonadota bacterium]
MKILVLNAGSSSIKFQLFLMEEKKSIASGLVEAIGEKNGAYKIKCLKSGKVEENKNCPIKDHSDGLKIIQKNLKKMGILDSLNELDGIGHRVVQGADLFSKPTLIDEKVIKGIEKISPLAPLHNPAHLKGIKTALKQAPNVPEVAVFDTAFHQSLPQKAYMYAIGYDMYEKYQIRKYGFHGTSHYYVAKTAAKHLGVDFDKFNAISLHLGNGSSACAIKNGKSIDTSMGLTPLAGLIMGTRCGDIDPSALYYISQKTSKDISWINNYLNKESGLKGLAGSNDLRDILKLIEQGDKKAILAYEMMIYRLSQYIGSYYAILGRLDALIFTGGIGENASALRYDTCKDLEHLVLHIDKDKNAKKVEGIQELNKDQAKVKILKIPTNEELEIALQTRKVIKEKM